MDWNCSIRFDRNEFAGSFGDIGTTLPLIIGMILVTNLQASAVFTLFGVMLIFTGLNYRIPMPVQPLKAVAIIVITSNIHTEMIHTAGFIIGVMMILLSISGLLTKFGDLIPVPVICGIQLGLGLKLATLALGSYLSIDPFSNFFLTATDFKSH